MLIQAIGDLARPYTFYTLATATMIAIIKIAWTITDGYQAAAFMGVILAGASAIYIGKSFENKWTANAQADVAKAREAANVIRDLPEPDLVPIGPKPPWES